MKRPVGQEPNPPNPPAISPKPVALQSHPVDGNKQSKTHEISRSSPAPVVSMDQTEGTRAGR